MTAPNIVVRSAPKLESVRRPLNQTGILGVIGDTQWGKPQSPTFSATFLAWVENHGGLRSTMNAAQLATYLQVLKFFENGGEGVMTVRAHAMANSVDPQADPTGIAAARNLSAAATTEAAPVLTGERSGPFTLSAGQQMTLILDEDDVQTDVVIQNATFITGTLAGNLDLTSDGHNLYIVVDGVLQTLAFAEGTDEDEVPDETDVTLAQFVSAFNAKMEDLGFHSRMEALDATDWRINVSDEAFSFSTGTDALTATELGADGGSPESAIMILAVGADSVDLTTDSGTTTTLDLVFDRNDGGGVDEVTVQLVDADFTGGITAALITEVVAKFNLLGSTTGIRAFTEGSGGSRTMTLVADETTPGAAPSLTYKNADSTANFAEATLDLDSVTTDTGVISKSAPTSLTASAAVTMLNTYLGALATAAVHNGSQIKITHADAGALKSLRIDPGSSGLASVFGFHSNAVYGTDTVSAVAAALRVDAKYVGAMGNAISVRVVDTVADDGDLFDLEVYLDGDLQFTLADLSMDAILLEDASDTQNLVTLSIPATNTGLVRPDAFPTALALTGGSNGDTVTNSWYIGTRSNGRGPYAFFELEASEWPDLLISPDMPAGTTDGNLVQPALVDFGALEDTKERVHVIPTFKTGMNAEQYLSLLKNDASYSSLDISSCFHIAVRIQNPSRSATSPTGTAATLTIPNSGAIAGTISRGDHIERGGIHKACAGIGGNGRGVLRGVLGLEVLPGKTKPETSDFAVRKRLAAFRSNWLQEDGQVFIGDVRVKGTGGNYDSIPARRGHSQLFRLMREALKSLQFQNIDEQTIDAGKQILESLLDNMLEDGGFASRSRSEAFRVDAGPGVNTDATRAEGRLVYRVQTAPVKPARFVEVLVSNLD